MQYFKSVFKCCGARAEASGAEIIWDLKLERGHPDIPIPYLLLLYIPLPVISIPDIPTREG